MSKILNHDGGIDDFAALAILQATYPNLTGVIITNGDSEPKSALSATCKALQLFKSHAAVGISRISPWISFPWCWRAEMQKVNLLPSLKDCIPVNYSDGDELLIKLLSSAEKTTIIATGPLTSLAYAFKNHPELSKNIEAFHWMGGAIDVPGNLRGSPEIPDYLLSEKGEWNVFADTSAADWIFTHTSFPIYLYPLDISGKTMPNDFLKVLKPKTVFAQFVKEGYEVIAGVSDYRMWDVVAAVGVTDPSIFEPPTIRKLKVLENGAIEPHENGRDVHVFTRFKNDDLNLFYQTVANRLAENNSFS